MTHKFDILVIGSGIAGLNFALQAAPYGQVAIVTKKELMESNSNYAQGGIAAVMNKTDNFTKHIEDTLKAGCYLNNRKAVEIMVKQAPKEIKRLIAIGVGFAREQNQLALSKEGGHSQRRIAHTKDATGKEIERALIHQVRRHKNITIFESHLVFELISKNKKCLGALVLKMNNGKKEVTKFFSKATILATGGIGQVYQRNSNPKIATGDGLAMAQRVGANTKDMEFIQFHPTALAKIGKPAFLLSETLRGEGAILRNYQQKAFMQDYHSQKELANRDIVARAIFSELKKGPVYLDMRHQGSKFIKHRFPYIYEQLWWYGIKMDKELISVAPAAHYLCGGVHTDLHGRTNIPGLFAFGEVAQTGVHGANRLASNSLLECLVFSSRAVPATKNYIKKQRLLASKIKLPKINKRINPKIQIFKKQIRALMWHNVGIIREPKKMIKTLKKLEAMQTEIDKIAKNGVNKQVIELTNLHTIAILITQAALNRKKSICAHYLKPKV